MLILPTLLAAAFYAVATFLQWQILQGERKQPRKINQLLGWAGFACHTVAVYTLLHQPQGIHLGFFAMGSLVSWLVVAIVLLSSIRQAIDNLFIGVFPIALLATLIAGIIPEESIARDYDGGLITHILLVGAGLQYSNPRGTAGSIGVPSAFCAEAPPHPRLGCITATTPDHGSVAV